MATELEYLEEALEEAEAAARWYAERSVSAAGIAAHIAVFCLVQGVVDMPRPTDVKALPNHCIWLRYDDGIEGEVDLSDLAGHGVFEPWNDAAFFDTVHLGSHGAIEWSPDLDLCPDAMYLRLAGKSVQELFPEIRLVSADA